MLGEPAASLETRDRLSHGTNPSKNKRWLFAAAIGVAIFGIAVEWMRLPTSPGQEQAFPSKFRFVPTEVESLMSVTSGIGIAVPTGTGDNDLATITVTATQTAT